MTSIDSSPQEVEVFAWLTGQHDNIGDSALRRAYADMLRTRGRLHVWAGDPNAGYVSGLRLEEGELIPTFGRWYRGFVRSVLRGRALFAFNAGEFVVTRGYLVGVLLLLPWIVLLRIRKGEVLWLGASIRLLRKGFGWPFRLLAKLSTSVRWRDTRSSETMHVSADVMPDWAFALAGSPAGKPDRPRRYLAISLRGDRTPPGREWLDATAATAERLGLRPIVVTQVERDGSCGKTMAEYLGCEFIPWTHDSHLEQERLVREVYADSRLIVSDRLHALIIAATEGAIPLSWTPEPTPKVAIHLDVVGYHDADLHGDRAIAALNSLDEESLRARQSMLTDALARARGSLRGL